MADNGSGSRAYLVLLWSPKGYQLVEREGVLPHVGDVIEESGEKLEVGKIGPSPLPADPRPCVFTVGAA